jgi:NAD+ diphosphatase
MLFDEIEAIVFTKPGQDRKTKIYQFDHEGKVYSQNSDYFVPGTSIASEGDYYIGSSEEFDLFIRIADAPQELHPLSSRSALLQARTEHSSLGRALVLFNWLKQNKYCGNCGSLRRLSSEELRLDCSSCGSTLYPRLSPAIITLVHRGDEALLVQTARHRKSDMFSTIAGFVEPGEKLEDAVKREVMEETNVQVKNIQYLWSQPWPFPDQLMLGFFAEYSEGEAMPDGKEVLECRWFHRDELPKTPPNLSIAGRLIERFRNKEHLK